MPDVDRVIARVLFDAWSVEAAEPVGRRLDLVRAGHLRHGVGVLEARLGHVERRRQREDRLAVLDRGHPARRERPAIADPLHYVHQRHGRAAGPDEVRVQRVHRPVGWHCAARRHQRLAGHLAAKDALPLLAGRAPAAEDVQLDLLEVEQADDLIECLGHGRVRARASDVWLAAAGPVASLASCPAASGPVATWPCCPAASAHSASTASAYRSSLTTPTPGTPASCWRVTGRVSAIAWSVASEKIT